MKLDRIAGAPGRAPPAPARGGRPTGANARSFVQVMGEGARPPPSPRAAAPPSAAHAARPTPRAGPAPPAPPGGALRALAAGSLDAERTLDAALRAARTGKTFTPAELLALQATAFRYSQTVEILSRAADRLVGAVKQTLGT